MIRTFFPAPTGAAEAAADVLRVLALICIVIAGLGWGPIGAATMALAAGGTLVPRVVGVRPSFDIAFAVVLLVAAWSSVLQIYESTPWWDLPVHFLANGLCAALCYIAFAQLGIVSDGALLPRPVVSTVVMVVAIGLALGVIWEILEWFGHTFIDEKIFVSYVDTIGDLVWGGAGAVLAGYLMPFLRRRSASAG
ncbi:MAG TPA: hypothetical protein VEX88_15575 [Glaciibacter sp.]|nr:hypothetical protein [Glaciibacter sp.]